MEKKNIDWGNLGFGYVHTDYRFVSNFKDGNWDLMLKSKFRIHLNNEEPLSPEIIELLNNRHIAYTKSQQLAYELEKQGKAIVFAPSEHLSMGTFTMDAKANERLYELGISDYQALRTRFRSFMELEADETINNDLSDYEAIGFDEAN